LDNKTYLIKIARYKIIPLIITWILAVILLFYTNDIPAQKDFWNLTISIGGVFVVVITAYATKKILDCNIEKNAT